MSEIFKGLWGKLYAWGLPSALALGATWLFLLPRLSGSLSLVGVSGEQALLFLALTGTLAVSLSSLSTQLYGLLEGYLWPRWLQEWGIKRHRARKKALQAEVERDGSRRGIALQELARYPLDDHQIAPTRFGNAIRAFETYGKTRFNLDSQTLWHELVSVAPDYIQSEINSAHVSVDFFVASLYLSVFYGFAGLVLGTIEHFYFNIMLSIPAFSLAILFHWLAIRAVENWSYSIQALVNTGRTKLADSMGFKLPETLEEEKAMWGLLVGYTFYGSRHYGEALNSLREGIEKRDTFSGSTQNGGGEAERGGFVFVSVKDEHKAIFSDAVSGFGEYARLKGYRVTLAIDNSAQGKVGFKFIIMDREVTDSTEKVRRDVNEYITKLKDSDDLGDMPIVTDPIEHEKLVSALKMRFSFIRHEMELHAIASETYKNMLMSMKEFTKGGIGYAPSSQSVEVYLGGRKMRDVFKAEKSPGAAVGKQNKVEIEGSTINVGSSISERNSQVESLKELTELVRASSLAEEDKHNVIRNLENAREEIEDNDKPQPDLIAKWLGKVKTILQTASAGAELMGSAKAVLALFGIAF